MIKHYLFQNILISLYPHVKNSLYFNLAYFPVNLIKQFLLVSLPDFIMEIPIALLFTLHTGKNIACHIR